MKKTSIVITAIFVLLIAACNVTKKSKRPVTSVTTADATPKTPVATVSAPPPTQTNAPPPTTTSNTSPTDPFSFSKPSDGIYDPGTEELTAIQTQYKEVTLSKLKEGYVIYAQGACLNCHNAKGIYYFKTSDWKGIIDDMSQKALLSDTQKDAVYKYVLSIKATQPK